MGLGSGVLGSGFRVWGVGLRVFGYVNGKRVLGSVQQPRSASSQSRTSASYGRTIVCARTKANVGREDLATLVARGGFKFSGALFIPKGHTHDVLDQLGLGLGFRV